MKIETRNVPVLGSSEFLTSSSLAYNIKDIASLILDESAKKNPYQAAYMTSYESYILDPSRIELLLDSCMKFSNDKNVNEGYCGIIGSYLAGFLMTDKVENNPHTNIVFGSLIPFIGIFVEIATRLNREDLLNSDKVCRMFKAICEIRSITMTRIDDSFDLSEKDIQESGILTNVLKAVLQNIYWLEHIPSDTSREINKREITEGAASTMRSYLSDKGYDSEYIENQIEYISDVILYDILENSSREDDTKSFLSYIGHDIRSEINDVILDTKTENLEKWTSRNMISATQGFVVSTIIQYAPVYFKKDGNKFSSVNLSEDKNLRMKKSIPAFMKTMQNYFKMEWYPDYNSTVNHTDSSRMNRKINKGRIIFDGIYKEYLRDVINVYLNLDISYDSYEIDKANKEWVREFSNEVFPKWNLYSKALDDSGFETPDDSDYYFKYIMGFLDLPMDEIEDSMMNDPECWDCGFDYSHVKPYAITNSNPSPNKKETEAQSKSKSIRMVETVATEASSSVRYQEKQGSRIGSNVGKAYDKARSGAGQIVSQFKKISTAVYKWITTDGNNDKLVLDGRKFTFVGLIKRLILSVGIFHVNIIAGVCAFIFLWLKQKKANKASRRKMIMMLEEEIQMVDEKIQDASADGNRKAKYALMRSKNQLQNALQKVKYGMGVDLKDDEQPAVRELRDRATSGGKIAPNDSLRTMNATRNTR